MSSKKYRKKLKEKYERKQHKEPNKIYLKDMVPILNYLKTRPYECVSSKEITENTILDYCNNETVWKAIKAINYYTDEYIETKKGRGGGYMYYG